MYQFAKLLGSAALLAATALHTGCGNSASGLTTGTAALPSDAPGAVKNDDPMARPVQVAWTSARATRCGFYFDPAKLRTNYLAYEARQGAAGEQLSKIEKSYDTTFKTISTRISGDASFCTDRKGADIKADLQRHLAGDFTPNLPKPKEVASCGFFGCSSTSDEKWDGSKWWKEQEMKRK